MKQLLNMFDVRKGAQNTIGMGATGLGLITALLAMEGVDQTVKFAMGCIFLFAILGLRAIAQNHNKDGTDAREAYKPQK